jgi:hypothetical protein
MPEAPAQMAETDCETPPSTVPSEVTASPNVNIVIADHAHPKLLDGSEAVTWDGWLVHNARARTFFCHRHERTIAALEAAPGPHKVTVVVKVFGNPGSDYADLIFELKSEHEIEVPESGVVVMNLDLSLDGATVTQNGSALPGPRMQYRDVVLPASAR